MVIVIVIQLFLQKMYIDFLENVKQYESRCDDRHRHN